MYQLELFPIQSIRCAFKEYCLKRKIVFLQKFDLYSKFIAKVPLPRNINLEMEIVMNFSFVHCVYFDATSTCVKGRKDKTR